MGKNASHASCKRGYGIYWRALHHHQRKLSRKQVNILLVQLGYDSVSERTYNQYAIQNEAGVYADDYAPINKFFYTGPGHEVDPAMVDRSQLHDVPNPPELPERMSA